MISLSINLTDEQYAQLLDNNYNAIFESAVFQDSLRECILEAARKELNGNPITLKSGIGSVYASSTKNLIEDILFESHGHLYPKDSKKPSKLLEKLVVEATPNQLAAFRNEVRMILAELLQDEDAVTAAISSVFVDAIRVGLSLGTATLQEHHNLLDEPVRKLVRKAIEGGII